MTLTNSISKWFMTSKHRGEVSVVMTTLIILVASVVLGTGVVLYGTSLFTTTQSTSQTPIFVKQVSVYDNLVDNETALELQIDKMLTTDQYCCQDDYNHKIVIERHTGTNANDILSAKITLYSQSSWNNGNVPIPMSISLAQHINKTLNQLKKEFTDKPFITSYVYSPIGTTENKIIETFSGNVVLNTEGIKVILKPNADQVKVDDIAVGTWLKMNYILHTHPCSLSRINLSNQTQPITQGNLTAIIQNPTNHGLMNMEESDKLYNDYVWGIDTTDPVGYDHSKCNTHDSYTYELVESHAR